MSAVPASVPRRTALAVVSLIAAVAAVVLVLGTRSDALDWSSRHPVPHAVGQLDPGFNAPDVHTFYSSQVVNPDPETWTKVRPSGDYRVLVLVAGKDAHTAQNPQVAILVDAVRKWAKAEDRVKLKLRYLSNPGTYIQGIDNAAKKDHADLIITAGNNLVEPVAAVSANYAGEIGRASCRERG